MSLAVTPFLATAVLCGCSSGSVSDGVRPSAQINFHRMQAGLVIAGDLFFRIEPADMGIGTVMFSRGGISGSLLSTKARREEVNARDFKRSFRAAFVFFRWRAITESSLVPYLGAGVGIYGLRESEPREYSNWEKGPFLQVSVGQRSPDNRELFQGFRGNSREFRRTRRSGTGRRGLRIVDRRHRPEVRPLACPVH